MSPAGREPNGPGQGPSGPQGLRTAARTFIGTYVEASVAGVLSRLGVTPNGLTFAGLVVAGAAAYLAASGFLVAAGLVLLASGSFDLLDGALARATGRASSFGALLDSVVDRVSEMVILFGILVFYTEKPSTAGIIVTYLALSGSVMVSYLRARAESLGIECEDGIMTRPERVITLSAALVVAHWWLDALAVALGAVAILTIFTAGQRMIVVRRRLEDDS